MRRIGRITRPFFRKRRGRGSHSRRRQWLKSKNPLVTRRVFVYEHVGFGLDLASGWSFIADQCIQYLANLLLGRLGQGLVPSKKRLIDHLGIGAGAGATEQKPDSHIQRGGELADLVG